MSRARDDLTVSAPQIGKTFTGGCWLLGAAWQGGPSAEPWWWCAPTSAASYQGYSKLLELAESANILKHATHTVPYKAQLINGAKIEARYWEKPENLMGPTIRGAVIDEFGMLTRRAYSALSSRRANTIVKGEGFYRYLGNVGEIGGEAEKLWDQAKRGEHGFAYRQWTWRHRSDSLPCHCNSGGPIPSSLETAYNHAEDCYRGIFVVFIHSEASRMAKSQFKRLYDAEWTDWSDLPVYEFERDRNVDALRARIRSHLPIELGCDFNVDPMVWTVGQHEGDEIWTSDEIVVEGGATTKEACLEFIKRYPDAVSVSIYGDSTGNRRGTRSRKSDYDVIKRVLGPAYPGRLHFYVPKANPPVQTRVDAVNAKLISATGLVSGFIHPRCYRLIEDRSRVSWKPGTRDIDKSNRSRTHASDSDDYRWCRIYPALLPGRIITSAGAAGRRALRARTNVAGYSSMRTMKW